MENNQKNLNQSNHPIKKFGLKFVLFIFILICLGGILFFLLPFQRSSVIVNQFAADGNIEKFTPLFFAQIRIPFLIFFLILLLACVFARIRFESTFYYLQKLNQSGLDDWAFFKHSWKQIFEDLKRFFDRQMVIQIILLTLLAFILRLLLLRHPMGHDESYSSVIFAFEPLYKGLADYHFPNNHVFHTFLVHVAYRIFGPQEWAVRLPAFVSGVLLVPAGYLLAKYWYGKKVAFISSVLIATYPELILFSVNARGYTLMALLTLLLFLSASYARQHHNSAAWFLVGTFSALGFYTLPIMAYPIVIIYAWLGFTWLIGDYSRAYSKFRFIKAAFSSGLFAIGLGLALYLPIFRNWGIKSVFANEYTKAIPITDFKETLFSRLLDTWNMLNKGAVPFIGIGILAGFLLSFIFYKKTEKAKIPIQITSLIVITFLVLIQRPNIYSRTWIFYVPVICIWSVAGWYQLFESKSGVTIFSKKVKLTTLMGLLLGIIFFLNGVLFTIHLAPSAKNGSGDVEKAALYLKEQLAKDDIVVITATDDARMWFYFEKYALGRDYFSRVRPFENAFVVVTRSAGQTVQSVIVERGPDSVFFDMDTQKIITTINTLDIYVIQANEAAVEKAYGNWK